MSPLVALLVLGLSHDAVVQGDLARLEKFADRVQLEVSLGDRSNLLSDSAARALAGWPAVVGVVLRPPLTTAEALQLRKIPRLHASLLGADAGKTLSLLGTSLIQTSSAPVIEKELERPCGNVRVVRLAGGAKRFEVTGRVDECVIASLDTRAEAVVPMVAAAQGVKKLPALSPPPIHEPLAAEPAGPAATVFLDVDGGEPDVGRTRKLVKEHLVGRTITGASLPSDGVSNARVLARARLLPLAALGKQIPWPGCTTSGSEGVLWRLVLATGRLANGRARLSLTLSSLRCSTWQLFGESETDFKSLDAALEAAVGAAEALLSQGPGKAL